MELSYLSKLEDFLISIINSITSHTADHSDKFKHESIDYDDGSPKDLELKPCADEMVNRGYTHTPEDVVLQSEQFGPLISTIKGLGEEDEEIGMIIL